MPVVINALTTTKPDSDMVKFKNALGSTLVNQIVQNWSKIPQRERKEKYFYSNTTKIPQGNFGEQLIKVQTEYLARKDSLIINRMKIINSEVNKAIKVGIYNYQLPAYLDKDLTLAFEIQKKINDLFSVYRFNNTTPTPIPAQSIKKYAVKLSEIICTDNDELGHDEIYIFGVAVDGSGNMDRTLSRQYSMNDQSDCIVYPNYYLYSPNDPKDYLDVAIEMWESDGNYDEVAKAFGVIGSAVAMIPTTGTVVAGAAIMIIGGIVGLIGLTRNDKLYGSYNKVWPSKESLESGIGYYSANFYNRDEGILDFEQWNFITNLSLIGI